MWTMHMMMMMMMIMIFSHHLMVLKQATKRVSMEKKTNKITRAPQQPVRKGNGAITSRGIPSLFTGNEANTRNVALLLIHTYVTPQKEDYRQLTYLIRIVISGFGTWSLSRRVVTTAPPA